MNTEHPDTDDFTPFKHDAHYQHLMDAMPSWLRQATPQRREALSKVKPGLPANLKGAAQSHHVELGKLIARQVTSQNRVDQALANLQNPATFAEPLLKAAIKNSFGLDLDVRKVFLRLYIPTHFPWLRMKTGAARIWTVSLLDAALHNFESGETVADAFEPDSTYIAPPSSIEQFNALPQILQTMPITAFTRLCRELDIGARYQTYLEKNLGISNPVAAAILQPKIRESQHTALIAALHMAQMQKLLASDTHQLILGLLGNSPRLRLRVQSWGAHELTIMNARLTGILVFAPDLTNARAVARVVAYIPDDPEHPIKEYPSSAAFTEELSQRLRTTDYQQFFSRFVDHENRGHFFAQLNDQLASITWQPIQPGDPRPTWREAPNPRPNLHMAVIPIRSEPGAFLYQRKLDKILNDARVIAVSTDTVDQKSRWALWDSFTEIASALLNIAAFITLPFVPLLGELMLAYMAYQLLDETFESVVDWAEGATREAFKHFMGVVQSTVQLGTFAAGGIIAAGEFRTILPKEIVQFIDRFNSVNRPNGETRYWKPDLSTYEHPVELPSDAKPDALGLHRHQGKNLLNLEGKCYAVNEDPVTGQHRIEHPARPEAYRPELRHNGAGAWQTGLDQPLNWDRATVLRRIGPDMHRFPMNVQSRMLSISGCHENALRKMHVDGERLPPLLADTLTRFKIDQDIQTFIDQIGNDQPEFYRQADPAMQLQILNDNGYLPENKGLRLTDGKAQILWQSPAAEEPAIQMDSTRLHNRDLLQTFLLELSETETRKMMGESFGTPAPVIESRARTLRLKLAELAERKRAILFDDRYRKLEYTADPLTQEIMGGDRSLPANLANALLDSASEQERQLLKHGRQSKRLADLTAEARLLVRATRAYEGLELKSTAGNPDTERLALHSLERLPGWTGQLRLEIRQYHHLGTLIDSIGRERAPTRKVLVLNEQGLYQPFDSAGLELGSAGSLYSGLLQALPDAERTALNIRIGESSKLKQLIGEYALNRDDLHALLLQRPSLKPNFNPAVMRLLGGTDGYNPMPINTPSLQAHTQRLLPHLTDNELLAFVEKLQRHPTGPRAELTRLFAERDRLVDILNTWASDIPLFDPATQIRLNTEQFAFQRLSRRQLRTDLLECWNQQVTQPDSLDHMIEIRFFRPIIGELPQLNVSFHCVGGLIIEGSGSTRGVHEFLRGFSGLRRLELRTLRLEHLPEAISQSPQLHELLLSDCAITLTPESVAMLAAQSRLTTLDLYKNPLGHLPDVSNMAALNYVDVSGTGISSFPTGLLTRPLLRTALLNDNLIEQLPAALFELPSITREGFDLGGNPIRPTDRERIKQQFARTGHDFGIPAEQIDLFRVQALYTQMDQEQASDFIYLLPGTLAEGKLAITRLENELDALSDHLAIWTADIPELHPISGEPFTPHELEHEHAARDAFKSALEQCWRRETELDDLDEALQPTFELHLSIVINGELPVLNADFSHVSHLYMRSRTGRTSGVSRFLESFPKLKGLRINEYALGNLPETIYRMADLKSLTLSECHITLTEQSILELAQMERLEFLDLSDNPLGLTLDIGQMNELSTLILDNTGITELPRGMLRLKNLEIAELDDNAITHIPSDILELPPEFGARINLRDNPLDEESLQRLIAYFKKTGVDFGVEVVIERAEMEVSTSEGSDVDE
ncbi:dermonecrotic toxin domain-containing protein [Pseudomonas sp. McL0111]|uniref:dermonecrotic toxin domain-containing protein n=1 Tax=Pseudomonas sp. McL0111 TaxID=3457357 RepID=UPI00403E3947